MNVTPSLLEFLNSGLQLWVENGELCFRAPKGALTPTLRAALVQQKTALVAQLGERKKYAATTSAQQRLWFMERLIPGQPLYNVPVLFHIQGELDQAALEHSINEIVRRHESLRTVFAEIDGQPIQITLPPQPACIESKDLRSLPEGERARQVEALLRQHACQPFDLSQGPLARFLLLQESANSYSFLLNVHHIAFDGWSTGVFLNELEKLYAAFTAGQPSPLPELATQVADFAFWQRQVWQEGGLEKHLAYWTSQLGGEFPALALPLDHPRPTVPSYAGAKCHRVLPAGLIASLENLSHQENASLFMTLLAALQVLLYRYSGQTDIRIGTPVANRTQNKLENLIGFFVNTLPLRGDLSGNPGFRSFLQKTRLMALDAQTYQDLPLEKLVEALPVNRSSRQEGLFQVLLAVQNAPMEKVRLPGLEIKYVEDVHTGSAKFDLTVELDFQGDVPRLAVEYATDLFEPATIERLLGHYQTLLESIVSTPDQHIAALNLLTAAERQQLLYTWNSDRVDYPSHACMHTLFEAQVERTPAAPALIFQNETLTYQELDQRANRLAHRLQKLGVGPEVLVGVCMERTSELIVSLLAIQKAGGAYVPLDPNYPAERMAFMLEDTTAPVLLTQERLLPRLPQGTARIVCLDRDWKDIALEPAGRPACAAVPENLGYIIYTSGSTGRPKGVAIAHHNAVVMLAWAQRTFPRPSLDYVLAATSICFDLSVYEIFLPLSVGGCIVLADNAVQLPHIPARHKVTLVNTVPSAMAELVRGQRLPDSVQIVNLAGEPLKGLLVRQVYQSSNVHSVYNLYGPSEDTTYSTYARLDRDDPLEPSIGRPLSNSQAYVLDRHLQPVPQGLVGELYLAGDGVSRGYLNRPELTAERYWPDPFGQTPAGRMYKTGDLVRYRPNGDLEFLGRIDHQVKIRGFRIELGEIENALLQHPSLQDVVVVATALGANDGSAEDKRLVAYVVPRANQKAVNADLRLHLKKGLPEYMLPSIFVTLEALPLTPNGKVDRKALPKPEGNLLETGDAYLAPRTPLETRLAAIWAEVLKTPHIGIQDNFFNLGGHSLLALQVLSRSREAFGVDIPLHKLFGAPTVQDLAGEIEAAQQAGLTAEPGFDADMEGGRL